MKTTNIIIFRIYKTIPQNEEQFSDKAMLLNVLCNLFEKSDTNKFVVKGE